MSDIKKMSVRQFIRTGIYKDINELPLLITRRNKLLFYVVHSVIGCNHKCLACDRQGLVVWMIDKKTNEKSLGRLCLDHLRSNAKDFMYENVD